MYYQLCLPFPWRDAHLLATKPIYLLVPVFPKSSRTIDRRAPTEWGHMCSPDGRLYGYFLPSESRRLGSFALGCVLRHLLCFAAAALFLRSNCQLNWSYLCVVCSHPNHHQDGRSKGRRKSHLPEYIREYPLFNSILGSFDPRANKSPSSPR